MSATKKNSSNGSAICKPQARILAALSKAKASFTKERLAKASNVHPNWIAEYIGVPDRKALVSELVRGKKKLAVAGLVKITVSTDEATGGERLYDITPAGRRALAAFNAK